MYTEFLEGLAQISKHLDEAAKIGGDVDNGGFPVPYLWGNVEVRLDGSPVGYFEFCGEENVIYHDKPLFDGRIQKIEDAQ